MRKKRSELDAWKDSCVDHKKKTQKIRPITTDVLVFVTHIISICMYTTAKLFYFVFSDFFWLN